MLENEKSLEFIKNEQREKYQLAMDNFAKALGMSGGGVTSIDYILRDDNTSLCVVKHIFAEEIRVNTTGDSISACMYDILKALYGYGGR